MSSLAAFLLACPALSVDMKKAALVRVDCDRLGPEPRGVLKWMLTPALAWGTMNITKATEKYEAWLARHLRIIDAGPRSSSTSRCAPPPFPFLRATYYRWAQIWTEVCGEAARAPRVLAVGDLHVENFGTWRDIEGRLIWGINDFDEVWRLPYTNDLIRLATSALLADMGCDHKAGIGRHARRATASRWKPADGPSSWPSTIRRCATWHRAPARPGGVLGQAPRLAGIDANRARPAPARRSTT